MPDNAFDNLKKDPKYQKLISDAEAVAKSEGRDLTSVINRRRFLMRGRALYRKHQFAPEIPGWPSTWRVFTREELVDRLITEIGQFKNIVRVLQQGGHARETSATTANATQVTEVVTLAEPYLSQDDARKLRDDEYALIRTDDGKPKMITPDSKFEWFQKVADALAMPETSKSVNVGPDKSDLRTRAEAARVLGKSASEITKAVQRDLDLAENRRPQRSKVYLSKLRDHFDARNNSRRLDEQKRERASAKTENGLRSLGD